MVSMEQCGPEQRRRVEGPASARNLVRSGQKSDRCGQLHLIFNLNKENYTCHQR